jgi:hypothetical protein
MLVKYKRPVAKQTEKEKIETIFEETEKLKSFCTLE